MKKGTKLFATVLAGALAVGATAALAACGGNSHTWSEDWSSDATSHWHACTDEGCTEVNDKADHTFNEGEVTKAATYNSEGERTSTCTVCGYEKKDTVAALEKTGMAYLAAESKETVMGGMASDSVTNLTLDFTKKEAILVVYATINVGSEEEPYFMTLRQVADEQAAGDMGTQYIGKGVISNTGVGTYKAVWNYEMSAGEDTQETVDMTLEVPITVDEDGVPTAKVQMQGIHATELTLANVAEKTGTVTMSGTGISDTTDEQGNPVHYDYNISLAVDFDDATATLNVTTQVDVGGGYMMDFCLVTDAKDPDLEASNPMNSRTQRAAQAATMS